MSETESTISVGVGRDGSAGAVRFAVDEAARTQSPVRLVHVLDVPATDPFPLSYDTVEARGRELLRLAAATAAERDPQVPVSTELVGEGGVARSLVERGAPCSLLVVEHRHRPQWRRMFTGSVANGVAARARVPVVVVPDDWEPPTQAATEVTLAVQDPEELPALLATARPLARERSAEIVLLHSWWMDNGFDHELSESQVEDRAKALREPLEHAVGDDGPVTVRIDHQRVGDSLIDAAARSQLLVMGRRHHRLPLGTHLGPNARGAIDHARCPVVLTGSRHPDPPSQDTAPDGTEA